MSRVGIKGVDRLSQRFNNISNMDLKEVVNKATALVHGQAKELAPVGEGPLGESIHMSVEEKGNTITGSVYTNLEYAMFVEFGTGVKGNGTYPYEVEGLSLEYASSPWYIPVDKMDAETAEKYHFPKVHGKNGAEYYVCHGQEAQPYMYPALADNSKIIRQMFKNTVVSKLKENCKGGQ